MTRRQIVLGVSIAIVTTAIVSWRLVRRSGEATQKQTTRPAAEQSPQMPTILVTPVVSQQLHRQILLHGDLLGYQDVALYPRVQGFVEWIGVDRGSVVRQGQLLVRLSAPEMVAQLSEAEAKVRAVQSQRLEVEAKLAANEATYRRLKAASATPGVVAGNDVEVAQKTVEADQARVQLWKENEQAAREVARSVRDIGAYLKITAPFDGIVTERNAHQGSLVGSSGTPAAQPMLRIQQVSRLRLVIAVPEGDTAGTTLGTKVNFTVPAFPGETFSGVVERIGHSLDERSRTMPVELDVANRAGRLAPGMFADVVWPVRRPQPTLFVPPSAVITTTERTFVVRIRDGVVEWVDVRRGAAMGDLVEVFGPLAQGDQVVLRGTDELRSGTRVVAQQASTGR